MEGVVIKRGVVNGDAYSSNCSLLSIHVSSFLPLLVFLVLSS